MNCENVKKELELMFEGQQPGAEALSHIKNCAACGAEYSAMLKITCALKPEKDVKVPQGFNKGVWDKIGEPAPSLFGHLFKPAFALAGAAAAALVVFMVLSVNNAAVKKQNDFAVKPEIVKENKIEKAVVVPQEQAPVTANNNVEQPVLDVLEKNDGVSPGKMPVLVKSTGADKDYFIKKDGGQNNLSAASVSKNPIQLEGPLVIKNNVIKPLSGQGMTVVYKVDETCDVLIRIYNRKGEPVKTLVRALQGRGVYSEVWKGEDDKNMVVGDGIYIVHVKTCLTEQKIKAIVVK